ncbi:MAG: hypothetical protein AB1659_11310 [Thermodesulfobacteriota bacterium]
MKTYDGIFSWEGWGGPLKLGSGKCHLRIFDLTRAGGTERMTHLRPIIVLVTDTAESRMSVRSCAGHIATRVVESFGINHHRMIYIEYSPQQRYGEESEHLIPERYESVEFSWHEDKAIKPVWRELPTPMIMILKELMETP